MNFELIALVTLLISFTGLSIMVTRKIPQLKELPEPDNIFINGEFKKRLKEKAREVVRENGSSLEIVLQKVLSKVRIISLKIDKKVSDWIVHLRSRSLERTKELDSYWNEIKTSINKKKKDDGK